MKKRLYVNTLLATFLSKYEVYLPNKQKTICAVGLEVLNEFFADYGLKLIKK